MAVDAEDLLIQPFRDVVAAGAAAVANARNDGPASHVDRMARAAQALVREGERALTKVQLVWNDHVARHGDTFRETMVQQASIEKRRLELEELLWDFDDFTHPDEFDQQRYAALQAATKALALAIIDTAKRLNFETTIPPTPTGGFPPLPPLPTRPETRAGPSSRPPSVRSNRPRTLSKPKAAQEYNAGNAQDVRRDSIPSSPSTAHTRTSVLSDTSTSSSALLGSLDSLVIPEDPPDAKGFPPGSNNTDLLGLEELLKESSFHSERRKSRPASPRIPDCGIREDSTYYRLKGLCKGATRFRKDGHWGSIKLSSEYDAAGTSVGGGDMMRASDGLAVPFQYETAKVGTCSECGYADDLDNVELDKSNKPEAVRTSACGARYRLRLLFKSHLRQGSSSSSSETNYACLWCVQAGAVMREGDATVFRSAENLLRHLARHPQPLPSLSGISVRYGRLLPDDADDIFDLHLPESPTPVPMPENVARLATAVAVKDHYRRPGRGKLDKPPGYDADMLEFMEGARIVGVIFPEKWGGKYCLGRHDGEFGAFPAKAVELQSPQPSEIPAGGESGMSATARWKWAPPGGKEGAPWLAFGKGEVITNVQCLYADYWCWSGTNSKGKTGVFPQSHIDLQTLRGQDSTVAKKSRGRSFFGMRSHSGTDTTKGGSGHRNSIAG
ncbi:uncharacterized protein B0T15DRAFT_402453 [Chaetomium strumarium]|uniref:SH3 domain-containing protein n=1 Tax=Chaetomium strumarium TaxID=1170767 RepID=A0AAJ0GPL6_9PEZI|nr:hypothetical protein B0T15DRAFT_402453 [Chaetomium strumarium]